MKQLNTVIEHIKIGTLSLPGVNKSSIKKFRPFVVTMTAYPIWGFVWQSHPPDWKGLLERIEEQQLFRSSDTSAVKVINVKEMEMLGALQRAKVDVFQRLREWPSDLRWTNEPLQNFLVDRQRGKKGDYTTLKKYYLEAADMARGLLFSTS